MTDDRMNYAATHRNRDAILGVLARTLPEKGLVLETASGSGQHLCHFARALPHLSWQASDPDPRCRRSIDAWAAAEGLDLPAALDLDVRRRPWPVSAAEAVLSINMIHISPWDACLGLLDGAAAILPAMGLLYLYGPFQVGGDHTADSNARFDAALRQEDPAWGVRDLETVAAEAAARGLAHAETVAMPANNLSVVFRKNA